VCRWLDLDDSRSFIRMVRKTELHSFGWRLDHWKPILRTWNHPRGVKLLRHTPRIVEAHGTLLNVAFMHLGMDMSLEILRPSLFGEIAEDAGIFLPELLLETLILGWNIVWPHRRIPPIMSIEHLERLRGEVTEAYFRFAEQRCQRNLLNQLNIDTENIDQDTLERLKRFPPAPLIGVPGLITPLDSPEALKTEGTEMGHCLGNNSWFHLSRARMGYAYAITQAGERATVWLTRDEHKSPGFRVEQIRGPHNLPVSPKVTDLIFAWLDEHSAWVRHRELDRPPPSLSLLEAEPDALPEEWGTPPPLAHLRPADPVLFDHDIPF
jgi:hypothetical protein